MTGSADDPEPGKNRAVSLRDLLSLPVKLAAAPLIVSRKLVQAVLRANSSDNGPDIAPVKGSPAPVPAALARAIPAANKPRPVSKPDLGELNPDRLVVLGDGLAAGMGEFGLHEHSQIWSFPAQLACQLGRELRQPLLESPGLECPLLSPEGGVRPANHFQTTVLRDYPPAASPENLSVPGFTVQDAVSLHYSTPILLAGNKKQTAANLIFGLPSLLATSAREKPKTMLDTAVSGSPTLALVELGFSELMTAIINRNSQPPAGIGCIPSAYEAIIRRLLAAGACVVGMTVPSPFHTAGLSSPDSAAKVLKVSPGFLQSAWEIGPGDFLTVQGLVSIANQLLAGNVAPLCESLVVREKFALELNGWIKDLNEKIAEAARRCGCLLFDLSELYRMLATCGIPAGDRVLTADYLGGFFSLNGFYPGATGQAVIANGIIDLLNGAKGAKLPRINLEQVARTDRVAQYRPPEGEAWDGAHNIHAAVVPDGKEAASQAESCGRVNCYDEMAIDEAAPVPLELPPGLEQVLPLTRELSWMGDCMRVVDSQDPAAAIFGGGGDLRFDGPAMVGAHVEGALKFRFSRLDGNLARFEVEFVNRILRVDDAVLASPAYYRFPLRNAEVIQPGGMPGTGVVDLTTGRVVDFSLSCIFQNSGLAVLAALNPQAIPSPAIVVFSNETGNPRIYASSWAQFRQRSDGRLDFVFHGTAFVPLGPQGRYPLPFASAEGKHVVVSAGGTALHPALQLSTLQPTGRQNCAGPSIPANVVGEFEVCSAKSSFGDKFQLNHPEMGAALGRSYIQGRLRIQFGPRFGDSIPFHISFLPPAGSFDSPSLAPLQDIFPSRLSRGLSGHDTTLRFPLRTYRLTNTYLLEDPLDVAFGVVNARSGRVIGDFLHRGLIGQSLIFALFRLEPRTPKSSFQFRGSASFTRGKDDRLVFTFNSAVYIPYPAGFVFPQPDLASGFVIGPDSSLDPYLQLEAVCCGEPAGTEIAGGERRVISLTGDSFSYQFALPSVRSPGFFTYTNHSDNDAVFRSDCIVSMSVFETVDSADGNPRRVVNFTALGSWSLDPAERLHTASVEISRLSGGGHLSIQIDGGRLSNVDTLPRIAIPPLVPVH